MEKCGEIYRFGPKQFLFSCLYCDGRFISHSEALEHIEFHFILQLSKESASEFFDLEATKRNYKCDIFPIKDDNSTYVGLPKNNKPSLKLEISKIKTSNRFITASKKTKKTEKLEIKKFPGRRIWGPKFTVVQCDICKKKFRKRHMLQHCNSHHRIIRFSCPNCKRDYKTKYGLQIHMVTHSNIKKYHCDICGWQFHCESNLTKHIRTHTGEKPYKCSYCSKSFAQSSPLVTHTRIHTGEKPFKCSICPKAFGCSTSLRMHLRRHVNDRRHKCSLCNMLFMTRTTLREHHRIRHTGERPFKCKVCDKTFYKKYNYNQHVILHTDLKPYQCRECDKTFAQNAQRRSHERYTHNVIL